METVPETGEVKELSKEELESELVSCRKDLDTYLNKIQWLAADYDNYQKRVERNNELFAFRVKKDFLLGLLPIVDDIERGLGQASGGNGSGENSTFHGEETGTNGDGSQTLSFIQGMEMIYQNVLKFLESNGVSRIDCLYTQFDPYVHEAVMMEDNKDHEDGTILEVFQNGYLLNKETLRAAKVKVSRKEV